MHILEKARACPVYSNMLGSGHLKTKTYVSHAYG